MTDHFEIDFLDVESNRSGDAIAVRHSTSDEVTIHVVDAGFEATGEKLVDHINKYYGDPSFVDHVVVTHPDGDHAAGVLEVLEEFEIGILWMLCPWHYAHELIHRFSRFTSVESLITRLKEIYPNIRKLEDSASEKGILILEPLQGVRIGEFTVLSPSKQHYLNMIVESDKTPEISKLEEEDKSTASGIASLLGKAINYIRSAWGEEIFSPKETSAENEMSVVQYAYLCDERVLLTGDAGRKSLEIAADYAVACGLDLPGIDRFQVPHHGSRRNVSTELLDRWLGEKGLKDDPRTFTAIISSAKADKDHPKKAVVRACFHRGGKVISTEGNSVRTGKNAPPRDGWVPASPLEYPEDQEE